MMERKITKELLEEYRKYLYQQEKCKATIQKYLCDLTKLADYVQDQPLDKILVVNYKEYLKKEKNYKISSINSFLVAANQFFEYMGWHDLRVKTYKVQREAFLPQNKELTKEEYKILVKTANRTGKIRIGMILQTICATGIRVGEISAITVPAVKKGVATVYNKGKQRQILLPRELQVKLLHYIRKKGIKHGYVFCTSKGNAVDRTWIWREMKKLCQDGKVDKEKVFPHNLRHLFARVFYTMNKDIAKLADMLGHSNIETTRIYLKESYLTHRKQLEKMNLLVTDFTDIE